MSEVKRKEIENALQKHVLEVDRKYLRGMQKEMYECSAKCCANKTATTLEVNQCAEHCSDLFNQSHKFVSTELNRYQERLQRCVNQCNDEAKDTLGAYPTSTEIETASKQFERCACYCIDKQIDLLPKFFKTIHDVLSEKKTSKKIEPSVLEC